MSKRPQPVAPPKLPNNIILIDSSEIKVRKPQPPSIQWHRDHSLYRRRTKHPKSPEGD